MNGPLLFIRNIINMQKYFKMVFHDCSSSLTVVAGGDCSNLVFRVPAWVWIAERVD